ncbi:hypothetical protein CYMTET_49043 [Cymbomonas tetramitiformis]|uniref:Uncharacterized protein n=1 Tax=Cymbomonas tetramitiformis TaxID=36881 RepID=A0AAE0BS95_9CHLO|nr:hypothetical protein CYMTET_49043 [Cymbomonas tetramitiformis]
MPAGMRSNAIGTATFQVKVPKASLDAFERKDSAARCASNSPSRPGLRNRRGKAVQNFERTIQLRAAGNMWRVKAMQRHMHRRGTRRAAPSPQALVNIDFGPATFLGIGLITSGAALYQVRASNPALSRDYDIFFSTVGLLCGGILVFQGWRLDPLLLLGQLLMSGVAISLGVEAIQLRRKAQDDLEEMYGERLNRRRNSDPRGLPPPQEWDQPRPSRWQEDVDQEARFRDVRPEEWRQDAYAQDDRGSSEQYRGAYKDAYDAEYYPRGGYAEPSDARDVYVDSAGRNSEEDAYLEDLLEDERRSSRQQSGSFRSAFDEGWSGQTGERGTKQEDDESNKRRGRGSSPQSPADPSGWNDLRDWGVRDRVSDWEQ